MGLTEGQVLGGLFGVCIGDAIGVPVEGVSRLHLKKKPVLGFEYGDDMREVPRGWWSDDSSLTLCLAESLARGNLDPSDIASKFCKWLYEGYWTPGGRAFGIGYTTARAIERIRTGASPLGAGGRDEYSNGNGSLMRILPLAFYLFGRKEPGSLEAVHQVSSITHAHPRSCLACFIYVRVALNLLGGDAPQEGYARMRQAVLNCYREGPFLDELSHFERVLEGDIYRIGESEIRSGGYVVDTLEASLWCFLKGKSFTETVLHAVNLGGDTDTTGAVAGGIAGLYYGFDAIPGEWTERVARRDDIFSLGNDLLRACLNEGDYQ
jgi:ADP-ribosylglycohydrolase